ncbi:hypothetical protein [Olivibacter sp. XZL3]|uniref:hypothetical protein n=1 Tax=Olivibacter sp. XZL3 TaxID=1735116 RepID=UPI0010663228|nr:hypothetical protein [Olivibacter sp. XZL3]
MAPCAVFDPAESEGLPSLRSVIPLKGEASKLRKPSLRSVIFSFNVFAQASLANPLNEKTRLSSGLRGFGGK